MTDWPFTPEVETGGWQISPEIDNDGYTTYMIDRPPEKETPDQIAANVNLIAAAPRMYRALKNLLPITEGLDSLYESWKGEIDDAQHVIDWIDGQ